ncbi:MAG: protein kinase domain-containing protein [Polyangiaceae bacterium]
MSEDELSTRARLRVGTTLKGKYQLDRILGVGGMAVVYAATHRNRNRVAVKVLHPELAVDASLRARFIREGYVANTVEHRGTVRVLDDDVDEDGAVFLVMELLEGETLEARWERCGRRLDAKEVAILMRDLLDVLATAHTKGIVHRDIKPENLFLTSDGTLKVLDFGIARLRAASPSATRSGHVLGTPAFMPPEQALGRVREVDALSDVWAVGATTFTLLSGRLVHEGETPEEMMVHAATRRADHVADVAPGVPTEFAEIVDRALAFEKRERWPSAQAMRDALSRLLDMDVDWSSAPVQAHGDGDEDKTKIAAPPQMTPAPRQFDEARPLPAPQLPRTIDMPTRPQSTIAGVASRSTARRIRSGYTLAALGGAAAALVVIGAVVMRTSADHPNPTPPPPSALSSAVVEPTTAVPAALSTTPTASGGVEVVPVESLPRVATLVADAGPTVAGTRIPTEPARSIAPTAPPTVAPPPAAPPPTTLPATAAPLSTSPAASGTKAKCDPPYTVDKTGVKRWKLECL